MALAVSQESKERGSRTRSCESLAFRSYRRYNYNLSTAYSSLISVRISMVSKWYLFLHCAPTHFHCSTCVTPYSTASMFVPYGYYELQAIDVWTLRRSFRVRRISSCRKIVELWDDLNRGIMTIEEAKAWPKPPRKDFPVILIKIGLTEED